MGYRAVTLVDVNGDIRPELTATWVLKVLSHLNTESKGKFRWAFDVFSSADPMELSPTAKAAFDFATTDSMEKFCDSLYTSASVSGMLAQPSSCNTTYLHTLERSRLPLRSQFAPCRSIAHRISHYLASQHWRDDCVAQSSSFGNLVKGVRSPHQSRKRRSLLSQTLSDLPKRFVIVCLSLPSSIKKLGRFVLGEEAISCGSSLRFLFLSILASLKNTCLRLSSTSFSIILVLQYH